MMEVGTTTYSRMLTRAEEVEEREKMESRNSNAAAEGKQTRGVANDLSRQFWIPVRTK
jgi:hypothetical protein